MRSSESACRLAWLTVSPGLAGPPLLPPPTTPLWVCVVGHGQARLPWKGAGSSGCPVFPTPPPAPHLHEVKTTVPLTLNKGPPRLSRVIVTVEPGKSQDLSPGLPPADASSEEGIFFFFQALFMW